MKNAILLVAFLVLGTGSLFAQKQKPVTTSFWVAGACDMCKTTIESAVDVKGVLTASYDLANHRLTLTYKPDKISIDAIHNRIHEAGYDTENGNCTEAQYNRVHQCCKYRDPELTHP
jgi:copper chaperone CopZ